MRKLFISFLAAPLFAYANPVAFNFNEVSLMAFSQSTFRSLLHVDYVISPEVLAMDRKITLSVGGIEESKVFDFVKGILRQQGVDVEMRDSVYYLVPIAKPGALPPDGGVQPGPDFSLKQLAPMGQLQAHGELLEPAGGRRLKDDVSELYSPQNRPSDFLVSVVASAFGQRAAVPVGSDILLTGSKDDVAKMRNVLDTVDSLPKLVDVSASWIEVTDNAGDGRGISLMANFLGAKLGASIGTVNSGSAVSIRSSRFELVIDALKSDTRFKQVSNSRLVGDDYEKLVLTVGDETPTIASTGKDNAGNSVQNIVYRPSGVIVDVVPKVLGNGRIQLSVDGQISNFKTTLTGVTSSPTLIKRQVKTRVTVPDGDVLLIGGLNDRQSSSTSTAFSLLPSWASRSQSSSQTDLVLVLSAKVVKE